MESGVRSLPECVGEFDLIFYSSTQLRANLASDLQDASVLQVASALRSAQVFCFVANLAVVQQVSHLWQLFESRRKASPTQAAPETSLRCRCEGSRPGSAAAPRPNQALSPRSDIVGWFPVLLAWEMPSCGSQKAAKGVRLAVRRLGSPQSKIPGQSGAR